MLALATLPGPVAPGIPGAADRASSGATGGHRPQPFGCHRASRPARGAGGARDVLLTDRAIAELG
ncbi:hypothetical protein SGL43_04873 [Streptomyces globisporus]|uniref:Uncharacterized protein n=1 Tax=Streptomyces globisporus TaxID=1908 RepID=A0ABM9H2J8_STRGL|nr:hypothetical protein SGL43_04873 [Streptomyces globisporus]